jgi:ATPase family associated with various cellular activities (AAA)
VWWRFARLEARLGNLTVDAGAFGSPLGDVASAFDLDDRTSAFVWACIVVAVDPMMYPHLIAVSGVDGRRGITPAAFAALTGVTEIEAFALVYWLSQRPPIVTFGLLEQDSNELLPIATPYRASPRLVAHVLGGIREPQRAQRVPRVQAALHDEHQRTAVAAIAKGVTAGEIVIVEGPRGVGRRSAVANAIALDVSTLVPEELDRAVRTTCAEATLLGGVPVISDLDRLAVRDTERASIAPVLARICDELRGPLVITTATVGFELPTRRRLTRVTFPIPDVATRHALWRTALSTDSEVLRDVALRHKLTAGQIIESARHVREVTLVEIMRGIRSTLADRFGSLVERLSVDDDWDAIVLPAETSDQLASLVARVQHAWTGYEDWRFPRQTARGGGVAALFSGPPGTGKTMVAGLIARDLGRDLYRVDLSQIVSKWVGETEKQLGQVFDAAESGNALLLFDEADSLFARRTEVKSSSDRYANLEVNYLLQRIETFGGMTILTTNLDTSIDPALRRRLAAHVVFWPPEHDERVELWRRFLSTRAPIEDRIDHEGLACSYPDMTGANIRNAALAAAFLAAREEGGLSNERVHRAARAEYRAMGRVLAGRNSHSVDYMLGAQTKLVYELAGWRKFQHGDFDGWAAELGGWDLVTEPDKKEIRKAWTSWLAGGAKGTLSTLVDGDHPAVATRYAKVGVVELASKEILLDFTLTNGRYAMVNHASQAWMTITQKGCNAAPSAYALTAPEEYFAECYANYYREFTAAPTSNVTKGATLVPWIKSWFDANVDKAGHNPQRAGRRD